MIGARPPRSLCLASGLWGALNVLKGETVRNAGDATTWVAIVRVGRSVDLFASYHLPGSLTGWGDELWEHVAPGVVRERMYQGVTRDDCQVMLTIYLKLYLHFVVFDAYLCVSDRTTHGITMPFPLNYAVPVVKAVIVPGEYSERYCGLVVDHLATGVGILSFARSIGVTKKIINKWAKEHPEFVDALDRATAARAAYWEDQIIACTKAGRPSTSAQWMLKNIDPDEYKDKTEVQSTNFNLNVNRDDTRKSIEGKLSRIIQIEGESVRDA